MTVSNKVTALTSAAGLKNAVRETLDEYAEAINGLLEAQSKPDKQEEPAKKQEETKQEEPAKKQEEKPKAPDGQKGDE